MDINDEEDTITVAPSPWLDGNNDSRDNRRMSYWCKQCQCLLFDVENQWRTVGERYVYHARGEGATDEIEVGMRQAPEELDGSKELEGCKVCFLTCMNMKCRVKVGIHCLRGTRDKRYRNLAMLRRKMVIPRATADAPAESFNVLGGAVAHSNPGHRSQRVTREVSPPSSSLLSSTLPIRDSVPLEPVKTTEMASKLATEPACKACRLKHMKCDRRKPTCTTCEMTLRNCVWDIPAQPPSAGRPRVAAATATQSSTPATPATPPIMAPYPAPVDCGQCRMRHIDCDRAQPVCGFCVKHVKTCNYNAKKANAVDKASFRAEKTMEFYGGDVNDGEQVQRQRGTGANSGSDDDGIQAIRPRASRSSEAENIRVSASIARLEATTREHERIIEEQQTAIGDLRAAVEEQARSMSVMGRRLQTMENILRASRRSDIERGPGSDREGLPDTTPLIRQNAPAKRGGGGRSRGPVRTPTAVTPAKRPFGQSAPLEAREGRGNPPSAGHRAALAPDAGSGTHVMDDSLYDATPPPTEPGQEEGAEGDDAMDVESPSPGSDDRTEDDGDDQQAEEAETQRYLREHVRDEDPDDGDFQPAFDDSQSQARGPGTQSVAASMERLLSPARPASRSTESRGGSHAGSRGRGSNNSPSSRRTAQTVSGGSFVPSAPPSSSLSGRRTTARRGFSGIKPVPSRLSHEAFSGSQPGASTPDDDNPSPKRQKTATTPTSASKPASSRYPHGRVRDEEGYLLNNNGERDKRSVRGKHLGNSAFRKSDGAPQPGGEGGSGSPASGNMPARSGGVVAAPSTAAAAATPISSSSAAAPTAVPPVTTTSSNAASMAPAATMGNPNAAPRNAGDDRPDVAALAAQAEQDRVTKAHGKGQAKEYSARHKEIMSKMRL